jgi:cytochrome c553
MKKLTTAASLAAGLFLAAAAARAADAAENWTANCASCHGKDGSGNTKAGRKVGAKDLTNAANQKEFTDEQAFKDLKEGLKDKDGNDKMRPFADKLSDDEMKALVAYVRTLKK